MKVKRNCIKKGLFLLRNFYKLFLTKNDMGKRGMSQIVTTVILILLILVAIGAIWAVVNTFIIKGTDRINLDQFTLDLKIKYAKVNFTTGIAEVRVVRNPGEGELTKIKFIVEDDKNSEVFDEDAETLYELGERTYFLDLLSRPELYLPGVTKISIAPIYIGSSGIETIGGITDSAGNLNSDFEGRNIEESTNPLCDLDTDCGITDWIPGTEVCSDDLGAVMQYKDEYKCIDGFCAHTQPKLVKEDCTGTDFCSSGMCTSEPLPCVVETDCGIDKYVGNPTCSVDETQVVQEWEDFSCIDNFCSSLIDDKVKETCEGEEICYNGECFIPVECSQNSDCSPGEVCREGECVLEEVINAGTIRSTWPFGVAEYFDSFDLPITKENVTTGLYVIFPGSSQSGCLKIKEFYTPDFVGGISYIRLNQTPTNVSDGNNYEVWETNYICSIS